MQKLTKENCSVAVVGVDLPFRELSEEEIAPYVNALTQWIVCLKEMREKGMEVDKWGWQSRKGFVRGIKNKRCFSLDIALHERMRFDVLFQSISCGFCANRIMNSRQYTVQLSFLHCSPRFVENSHKTFNSVYQQTQDQISVWIEREYRAPNRFAARLRRNPSPL